MHAPVRFPPSTWPERLVLAVLAVAFALRYPVHFLAGNPFLMDFNVYHLAAQQIASGQGAALYDFAYSEGMYFKYAPLWAALWLPLAPLSPLHGAVIWTALNTAWLILTCWLCGRIIRRTGLPYPPWISAVAVVTLVRPLMDLFGNGQVDLWWGGLVLLFLTAEVSGRPRTAALFLALSITLKLPSAVFLPYLALTRRRRTAMRTCAWLGVLLVLGAFAVEPGHPWHPLMAWLQRLADLGPQQSFRIGDQSLLALCGRLFSNDTYGLNVAVVSRPAIVAIAGAMHLALFGLIAWPRRDALRDQRLAWDTALLMLLMTLASPSAWLATYSTLIFPLCLALAGAVHALRTRRIVPATIALGALIAALSTATHGSFWKSVGLRYWNTESYVYLVFMIITLLALALFAVLRLQRRRLAGALPDTSRS